jgi:2,5-dioxopentanoate dehydrogenase
MWIPEPFETVFLLPECHQVDRPERRMVWPGNSPPVSTVHMDDADLETVRALLPTLERRAGRILVNGWPTGVEVGHAMVHGGPYPATSDSRTTSVGSLAIRRFLRPVCYQDLPQALLPEALRDGNPWNVPRLVDGKPEQAATH